jgi:hypothetical protein
VYGSATTCAADVSVSAHVNADVYVNAHADDARLS